MLDISVFQYIYNDPQKLYNKLRYSTSYKLSLNYQSWKNKTKKSQVHFILHAMNTQYICLSLEQNYFQKLKIYHILEMQIFSIIFFLK